jgi:hypothetical protein
MGAITVGNGGHCGLTKIYICAINKKLRRKSSLKEESI